MRGEAHCLPSNLPATEPHIRRGSGDSFLTIPPTLFSFFFSGVFQLIKKCDLRPTRVQKYLGILCDSSAASFRVPQSKLDAMHAILTEALQSRRISFRTLQRVAGKVMSMTVAIRPAALYTQAMFTTLAALEKNTQGTVDLSLDSSADLVGEMNKWLDVSTTSHEGPCLAASATLRGGHHFRGIGCFLGSVGRCGLYHGQPLLKREGFFRPSVC